MPRSVACCIMTPEFWHLDFSTGENDIQCVGGMSNKQAIPSATFSIKSLYPHQKNHAYV